MIYNFTDNLDSVRKSYQESSKLYKDLDLMKRKTGDQGEPIGSGYSLDDYSVDPNEVADNDDYQNVGVGSPGYDKTVNAIQTTMNETKQPDGGLNFGSDEIMQSANLAMDIGRGFSTVSGSEKESWAQTGKWALQGGKLGMQVGGPIGAGVGAVAGAAAGVIDTFGDISKRNTMERDNTNKKNEQQFTSVELNDIKSKDEKRIKNLIDLKKNQLNYINLDNY